MSFEPPAGILDIGNATLRVGKLEVSETAGLNQGLQNIVKNDLLITEKETYLANKTWGIKLPTAWVGEFDLKTHDNKYVEFNFYNEGSTSNALGYTLNFKDTTLTLKYDNGNNLASETIPDVSTSTYKKVNVFFERGVIAVFIDGARVLYFKESDTYNSVHGHPGMASRVASTTGGSFVNIFIEADGSDSAVKDLRIVNGRFISDKTSNVSFIGSLGVGVNNPKESLDIRGNMHLTRVSNVSQVSVDSNVVTEYTGPHDRPLRKYPEVALTQNDESATSGYVASASSSLTASQPYINFDGNLASHWHSRYPYYSTSTGAYSPGTAGDGQSPSGTLATNELVSGHQGEWVSIELPKKIKLEKLKVIGSTRLATVYQFPKDVVVAVSETGLSGSWSALETATLISQNISNHSGTINITTQTSYYKYFALIIKSISTAGVHSAVEISELEFYGHEEGSGSLDTTLKTVYNVPVTTGTQLEVYYDAKDLADGAVSSEVTDLSPNTNNGTVSGDPQISNGAFVFDGSGDYLSSTVTTTTGAGQWPHSYSFWMKADTDASSGAHFVALGTEGGAGSGTSVIRFSGENILWYFWSNDVTFKASNLRGRWVHIVGTYDGGSVDTSRKIFINNVEAPISSTGGIIGSLNLTTTSTPFKVGSQLNNTNTFKGSIANVRLYSKVLSADQVKELYDYQKDYFLGSKSQVTLYKGHLGVGVTEPSGQLELAGDERLQEYPPRGMTDFDTYIEGHGVFNVNFANYYSGNTPWGMYTKTPNTPSQSTIWYGPYQNNNGYSGGNVYSGTDFAASTTSGLFLDDVDGNRYYGAWTTIMMPHDILLKNIRIYQGANADDVNAKCAPEDGVILGSNNGIEWYHVHTFTGLTYGGSVGTSSYSASGENVTINTNKSYKHYALVVTRTLHYAFTVIIGELQWFGTPGPTTLDKGSLSLTRSLDVPRVSRYDVDTETPRPEKLVIHYDTTVNSGGQDISGEGHHGRFLPSTASQRPYYKLGDKSIVLNGSTSYIFQRDLKQADGNFVHSVSYWLKDLRPSNATSETFLYFGSAAVATQDMQIQYNYNGTGTIYFGTQGSWQTLSNFGDLGGTGKKILRGDWNHYAYTYNGTNTSTSNMKFYINGEEMPMGGGGTSALNFTSGETNFYIGRHASSSNPNYFEGEFSNFMMYNTKLEPSEIKKLYRLGRTGRSTVITDTAVGIGIAPEAQLDVRGDLLVRGSIRTPQRPVFYAYNSGAADTTSGFTGHLLFPHTKINVGRCYNTYDRKFYAPVAGYYFFEFQVLAREANGGAGRVETTLYKNNGNISGRALAYTYLTGASDHDNLAFTTQLYLDAGDSVHPVIHACDSNMDVYYGEDLGHFSGFFIG